MPEEFLRLDAVEQSKIYRAMAERLKRTEVVLEKDVWVCWVLQALFAMPGRLPMAFKGGTSLSKVYRAIDRFSEDVDITIDFRSLDRSIDPFAEGVSTTKVKKYAEGLKDLVRQHVRGVVVPHLERLLNEQVGSGRGRVEIADDGQSVRLHYPTALASGHEYVSSSVLIEFGGRNVTEPSEALEVTPDIAASIDDLAFPKATVTVLSVKRTFWEKATLIHVACNRGQNPGGAERYSRHWYDLYRLSQLDHGEQALADRELLADVIRHKKVFFDTRDANYGACLARGLRLVPDRTAAEELRRDYEAMIDAGMFLGDPPPFEEVLTRLGELERRINK